MPDVLDWDETYYASTTATAARGLGLYPFVQGYPQIPSMGGVGYGVYFYVLAYQTLGPYLLPLRFVSLGRERAGGGWDDDGDAPPLRWRGGVGGVCDRAGAARDSRHQLDQDGLVRCRARGLGLRALRRDL